MCRVAPPTPSSDREVNHVEGAWRQISKNEDREKLAELAASGDTRHTALWPALLPDLGGRNRKPRETETETSGGNFQRIISRLSHGP